MEHMQITITLQVTNLQDAVTDIQPDFRVHLGLHPVLLCAGTHGAVAEKGWCIGRVVCVTSVCYHFRCENLQPQLKRSIPVPLNSDYKVS